MASRPEVCMPLSISLPVCGHRIMIVYLNAIISSALFGINPRLGNANSRSAMHPAINPILTEVDGHRQAKPDSHSVMDTRGFPARLASVFLIAPGILDGGRVIGSGAAKLQHAVGQSAQERPVMRDEEHGSLEFP